MRNLFLMSTLALAMGGLTLGACGGGADDGAGKGKGKKAKGKDKKKAKGKDAKAKGKSAKLLKDKPKGKKPALLMVQAQFVKKGGKPKPGPAKMQIWRRVKDDWHVEVVEDEGSNVFHKAMQWRQGILTIGAMGAKLNHWTWKDEGKGKWVANTLWEKSWGGKFDRLRDIEIGDVTGDGKDDLVIATHDQGVVAVGIEKGKGAKAKAKGKAKNKNKAKGIVKAGVWEFMEMDQKPDTFVHEIEIGDLEGDGKLEFYSTPSARNKASGVSQPGGVARYDWNGKGFERSMVVEWEESHAKEILSTDLDGDGKSELYVVKEAHTEKGAGGKTRIVDPVQIVRYTKGPKGNKYMEDVVAELQDKQCRFLLPGDVNGDGKTDLVAAGMDSGLWMLEQKDGGKGKLKATLIDKKSGGFEHATHAADLDGDGKLEIYVASDKHNELRMYVWNGKDFDRTVLGPLGKSHITWNLQDGKL